MTLTELIARVRVRFGDSGSAVISADSTVTGHINGAYFDFLNEAEFPVERTSGTVSFSANDLSKALPTGVFSVQSAVDTTHDRKLEPIDSAAEAARLYPGRTVTGPPIYYRISGNDLHVYPTPTETTVVEFFYDSQAAALATGSDVPILPLRYHEAIVEGALARCYLDDENYESADRYQSRFDAAVKRALKDPTLRGPKTERYPLVRDTYRRRHFRA